MPRYPLWYVAPLVGLAVFGFAALCLGPPDSTFTIEVPESAGSANLTLPALVWGSAFLTISWSDAQSTTGVSLFYCADSSCPYANASQLFTGRTTWTEFYGESGGNGSIQDYWNNANPITSTHFLVAATGFSGVLPVLVHTVYHNPGPGLAWVEFSGLVAWEVVVAGIGVLIVALGLYARILR